MSGEEKGEEVGGEGKGRREGERQIETRGRGEKDILRERKRKSGRERFREGGEKGREREKEEMIHLVLPQLAKLEHEVEFPAYSANDGFVAENDCRCSSMWSSQATVDDPDRERIRDELHADLKRQDHRYRGAVFKEYVLRAIAWNHGSQVIDGGCIGCEMRTCRYRSWPWSPERTCTLRKSC